MTKKSGYNFNNLTKTQQNCLSLIESLGIYELRALARIFGGNSPTTMKRNDHIQTIMEKIISGDDIRPIPLRQGRPYKELTNIQGILDELSHIAGRDYSLQANKTPENTVFKKKITFKQPVDAVLTQKLFPIQAKGIINESFDGNFYFYNQFNSRYILVGESNKEKLQPFDFVEGTAVLMNDSDYMLETLSKINFQPADTYQPAENPYKQAPATEVATIAGKQLALGNRYLICDANITQDAQKFAKIVKDLQAHNIFTVAVVANVMEEDVLTIQSVGFDNLIMSKYEDSCEDVYLNLILAKENIKNLQNTGTNLAIFVQDAVTLANNVDCCAKLSLRNAIGHTDESVSLIKDLVLSAKAGENNKHSTLFVCYDQTDLNDQLFVSNIFKVSKKIDF